MPAAGTCPGLPDQVTWGFAAVTGPEPTGAAALDSPTDELASVCLPEVGGLQREVKPDFALHGGSQLPLRAQPHTWQEKPRAAEKSWC